MISVLPTRTWNDCPFILIIFPVLHLVDWFMFFLYKGCIYFLLNLYSWHPLYWAWALHGKIWCPAVLGWVWNLPLLLWPGLFKKTPFLKNSMGYWWILFLWNLSFKIQNQKFWDESSPCMATSTLSLILSSCKPDLRTGRQSFGCLATNGTSSSSPHSFRNKGLSLRALKGNIS